MSQRAVADLPGRGGKDRLRIAMAEGAVSVAGRSGAAGLLSLRCPSHAQSRVVALDLLEIPRVGAEWIGAAPPDGEARIEGQPRLDRRAGFLDPAEMRESRGMKEMRDGVVGIGLDRSSQPDNGLCVLAQVEVGEPGVRQPEKSESVVRRQPQRFANVGFCFLGA